MSDIDPLELAKQILKVNADNNFGEVLDEFRDKLFSGATPILAAALVSADENKEVFRDQGLKSIAREVEVEKLLLEANQRIAELAAIVREVGNGNTCRCILVTTHYADCVMNRAGLAILALDGEQ